MIKKNSIYDLVNYLDNIWQEREKIAVLINRLCALKQLSHDDLLVSQSDCAKLYLDGTFSTIDMDEDFSSMDMDEAKERLFHLCAFYYLRKCQIGRIHRIIRPVGSVKAPMVSQSGCMIIQFRWIDEESNKGRSKNFPPEYYEAVSLSLRRGDTVPQILSLSDYGGIREHCLDKSKEWVLPWESELILKGLID